MTEKTNWRNDPITRKQRSMLRSVDEYFTFDKLSKMTKGEASDYISEYFNNGEIVEDKINMRGNQLVSVSKEDVKMAIVDAVKGVLKEYGL